MTRRKLELRGEVVLAALAHPLRVRILDALHVPSTCHPREASPSELADELGATLGVVSYHVRVLERKHFITLVREEPRRGAVEHYYRAEPGATHAAAEIMELVRSHVDRLRDPDSAANRRARGQQPIRPARRRKGARA